MAEKYWVHVDNGDMEESLLLTGDNCVGSVAEGLRKVKEMGEEKHWEGHHDLYIYFGNDGEMDSFHCVACQLDECLDECENESEEDSEDQGE